MRSTSRGFRKLVKSDLKIERPKSSISKRSIDIYSQVIPLHQRIRKAYHMKTASQLSPNIQSSQKVKQRVDSDQPEAVYGWLD